MAAATCAFKVDGLDRPAATERLRSVLLEVEGVHSLGFDQLLGSLSVAFDPERTGPGALLDRIILEAGLQAEVLTRPAVRKTLGRWAVPTFAGGTLIVGMAVEYLARFPWVAGLCYLAATAIGGYELFPETWKRLLRRRLDIHVLMGFAIWGALIVGEWQEAATIAFLFALSEAVEGFSLSRARKSIQELVAATPEEAEIVSAEGGTTRVSAAAVRKGDRVLVRPGGKIPIDGMVLQGASNVDQRSLTGEWLPVLKEPGASVSAGTINGDGALTLEATSDANDSTAARIARRVKEAQASRAPIEKSVERFAAWYTPAVLAISLGLMLFTPLALRLAGSSPDWRDWFNRGLVVLVASCPCALVISTPVALAGAVAAAGRRGVLLRGGPFIEEFGRLRVLAFDKTGTLTRGEPTVVDVVSSEGRAPGPGLLEIAASVGDQGGHPLGRAISRHAREREIPFPTAEGYRAVPGLGAAATVDAVEYFMGSHRYLDQSGVCRPDFHDRMTNVERELGTAVAVSDLDGPLGWIRLADHPRNEAAEAVRELHALGIRTVMLTGDNPGAAAKIGEALGLDEVHAGLLPEDKSRIVAELIARRGSTGMVGDGVNDAPALTAARVSIVLGDTATGVATEAADVVLTSRSLLDLPWLVSHGRRTIELVRQNIGLALGTKALVIVLASTGVLTGSPALWAAVMADVGTTLVVTANALRLLKR